jgi:hypothetical protein
MSEEMKAARDEQVALRSAVFAAFDGLQTALAQLAAGGADARQRDLARIWHQDMPLLRQRWTRGQLP